ncbi:centromere-associated protein E [Rhynchocyon petersi]
MTEEGAVAVYVRVRPLISREEALGEDTQVYWKTDKNTVYQVDGSKSFSFDRVFHSNETTKNVYEEIAVPIIEAAIQGYNGTIFAYGQTASGKTYTMMGSQDYLGVIPRAIHDIFKKIKEFPDREFLLRVSYMEIYNETITDLLCDTRKMKPLIIREDFNRNVYVSDLTEEVVYTSEMALKWITKGEKNRHYGITKMNQRSSRSHTIFRMILESREKGEPSNCDGSVKVSHLNLVDLAGSERAAQTGAEGVRLKEGCNINRSLFILGQVIKKLSDGQVGGFINYRDSKLTRILQNSLGGNAKTRIICTITPVSFDETLTTLQFASTAKFMKNTPYVNEVSSDEALLKRYRKEIMDLKKQLEEVSLETRAQAMEKDQLAQLLEEKDLLQKVQIEKIQNLTQMLVTSSSLTSQQESKAKKKRRVTWCLGKINKMKDSNYLNEFDRMSNITKTNKASVPLLGDIDESLCSDADVFSNTLDTITEIEWNPATKLLSQETLESELTLLRANYDNLVLDYERLRRENEEMELKLKEKNDLDEFEALERKTKKDQEMQLIHEISNLKNLVKHAEVYNQDLENELSSQVKLLREKEKQIKELQKTLNAQISETVKMDLSYSVEDTEELKRIRQTLCDAETVTIDAKRESAFLRSENLELKEKMKELENTCKQMENDMQASQKQLETKKKMQVDLEKELQFAFNEIAKLTTLVDGKVPKDLLSNLELEKRMTGLQKELNKEIEENAALRKEVNLLSELKLLSPEVEMLRKELSHKTQELQQKTAEYQERLSEMEKLKEELENRDSRLQTIGKEKILITEKLQQTLKEVETVTQERDDLKVLQEALQNERDQLKCDIQDTVNMNIETQEQLRDSLESLKQHQATINTLKMKISEETSRNLHIAESRGETMNENQEKAINIDNIPNLEMVKTQMMADVGDNELTDQQQKIFSLIQEKNELQQMLESITAEKEQLKIDLKENIEMTIENQEELRILGDELRKQKEIVAEEKTQIVKKEEKLLRTCEILANVEENLKEKNQQLKEKEQQLIAVREEMSEMQTKINEMENLKDELKSKILKLEHMETEKLELTRKLHENNEEMKSIAKERNDLKKLKESFEIERNQLKGYIREIEATMPALHVDLEPLPCVKEVSEGQEVTDELKQLEGQLKAKGSTPARLDMEELIARLEKSDEELKSVTKERDDLKTIKEALEVECDQLKKHLQVSLAKVSFAQDKEESLNMNEKNNETEEMVSEIEQVKEPLKAKDSISIEMEMLTLSERLQRSQDELKSAAKEREDLKRLQEVLQSENDQLRKNIEELITNHLETEEELEVAHFHLKEQKETIDELKVTVSVRETEVSSIQRELETANGELQKKIQELQEKQEQLLSVREISEPQGTVNEIEHLQAKELALHCVETEKLELAERLQERQEEIKIIVKERDELKFVQGALEKERDQLRENIGDIVAKELEIKEELKTAYIQLNEHKETIDTLRRNLLEKTTQLTNMQRNLENLNAELEAKDLEKQEELKIAHMHLKERQESIEQLNRIVSEKTDEISDMQMNLKTSNAALKAQIQELQEKEHQLLTVKTDLKENMYQIEQFKKQSETQNSILESIEMEKLKLSQSLHETLKEMRLVTKERDDLLNVESTLRMERDQLRERFREAEANIQELKTNEHQLLKLKEDISETQKKVSEIERLKKQLKAQSLTLDNIEMENLNLAQKLHENLEEKKSVMKERDDLKRSEETLKLERDQLKENLREATARDLEMQQELKTAHMCLKEHQETIDKFKEEVSEKTAQISNIQKALDKAKQEFQKKVYQQNHKQVIKHEGSSLCDGELHRTEKLREKCFRIKELLKKYSERNNCYDCLNILSLDLEKEIEAQKELSIRVKANLSLPYSQTKQIQKLLTVNQRCSTEFHRLMEKLKYVLSLVTKIKEEHHESINKFEMDFINEVEKQNELLIKIQHLQQDYDISSGGLRDLKLSQDMDLHIEEILRDFSESDFLSIKTEFQHVLQRRKEVTQLLQEWLNTHFDIEKLKNDIQKENDRICQVNNFYNNKIIAMMNESTEFEERSATILKEWEQDLRSVKEQSDKMFKNYQTLKASLSPGTIVYSTTKDDKNPPITSRTIQLTTEKIQKLETLLREAKESAKHKDRKILNMQKELEMNKDMVAKLQAKVSESDKCLEKTREVIKVLQDKVALGAAPYKEEIEDLKTKLVKIDLEKIKTATEFEKEITVKKATVEYQNDVIRLLKENLRRSQQMQETSMISENIDPLPLSKTITCGGGSGIVQSTKALILKSEHMKLENEVSKLKQKNEQLIKQQNDLLSNNQRLSKEIKILKERTLKKETHKEYMCENSPKSPKVVGTPSKNRQITPSHCKEWNLQDPVPKESPKSWFFDSRPKSFPTAHPIRYFDNTSLGLCPEEHTVEAENVDPKLGPWHASSERDIPECKTQ